MSSLNTAIKPAPKKFTAEGAVAARITPLQELIRLTMSCMLWEDNFYVDGKTVAARIKELVHSVTLADASRVAIEARNNMKLRHVPLLIVREMARHPKRSTQSRKSIDGGQRVCEQFIGMNDPHWINLTLANVIQRPDELTEFLAIYWKDGKQPLSKQVKLGLAKAFAKFNEYQLAKYNRKKEINLKDVLFLCHSKPADVEDDMAKWDKAERSIHAHAKSNKLIYDETIVRPDGFSQGELLYGKLIYDQLETPDTWEVELSASKDKHASWLRLLNENKLGDLAFLRNLRNMSEAGVPKTIIKESGDQRKWGRVLPFRFIAAARVMPTFEPMVEQWMLKCMDGSDRLCGSTRLFVDVSGSMNDRLSSKSDLNRLDAAKALAILLREVCEDVQVYTFNTEAKLVPARRGFALGDAIGTPRGGTAVGQMYRQITNARGRVTRDIIITDEQSRDKPTAPIAERGYFINVASNQNGIGYKDWLHIDGFSESVVDYIKTYEANQA